MEPIKIVPHHAMRIFEVFYLGWKPEQVIGWYNDERMKQNGVDAINKIVSNPDQLVQIVHSYDEFCRMCPRNKGGGNYDGNQDGACHIYNGQKESDVGFAETLGLENVLCREPITSRKFFELMRPTYEKLLQEPEYDEDGFDENEEEFPFRLMFRMKR